MGTVNTSNPKVDATVKIFDRFYGYQVVVPANEYDVVNSFFISVFKNKEAAKNFTVTLFRVAQESDTPVLTLLQSMENQNQIEISATLAYYLNGLRSPSTLLGVSSAITPNYFTARNIVI